MINLLSGFRTKSSCRLSERSATYISTALTGAAHSGNLSLTATAKQPESSLSLIITICQKRMPMHSETATMIFRCSPISRTVLRWEMHTRLLFLTGCPLSQKKRAKTVSPSLWNIFPFFRAASCSSFLINTFSGHLPLHASYLLPANWRFCSLMPCTCSALAVTSSVAADNWDIFSTILLLDSESPSTCRFTSSI